MACADGMSARAAALHFGISRDSVRKMLSFSVPPGYRRQAAINRPKLDGFTEIIDAWLAEDRGRTASNATRPSGCWNGYVMSMGSLAATPSRPCEMYSRYSGVARGTGHHDLPRSHVVRRFGAGSPAETASVDRCGAPAGPDSALHALAAADQGGIPPGDRAADVVRPAPASDLAAHVLQPPGQEGTPVPIHCRIEPKGCCTARIDRLRERPANRSAIAPRFARRHSAGPRKALFVHLRLELAALHNGIDSGSVPGEPFARLRLLCRAQQQGGRRAQL